MPRIRRHGSTLVIVLAIALLLASQIYILMVFSSGSFRHTEKTMDHVRAVYIGESAFARVLARLKSAAWRDRWFKDAPVEERDVSLADGTYSSHVSTVDDPTQKLVNVWIQARRETSIAVMYWRVRYTDDSLDFNSQVYPRFFTFLSPDDPSPFEEGLAPSLIFVQNMIDRQSSNQTAARALVGELEAIPDFAGVARRLRLPPPADRVIDVTRPLVGPAIDQARYLQQAAGTLANAALSLPVAAPTAVPTPQPVATPPPTPTPTPPPGTPTPTPTPGGGSPQELFAANPDPFAAGSMGRVIQQAFASVGLPDPGTSIGTAPEMPASAMTYWQAMTHPLANAHDIGENASKFFEQMGTVYGGLASAQQDRVVQGAQRVLDYLDLAGGNSVTFDTTANFLDSFKDAFAPTAGAF